MILFPNWHTRTSIAGLLSFSTATASGCIAWWRLRNLPTIAGSIAWVAALESLLLLDMAVNGRWILHENMMQFALHQGFYAQRRGIQIAGLTILIAVFAFWTVILFRRLRGRRSATIAAWSALLSFGMWCVELVSLHAIDAVLYRKIGGFMVIAFVWMVLGATTAISLQLAANNV